MIRLSAAPSAPACAHVEHTFETLLSACDIKDGGVDEPEPYHRRVAAAYDIQAVEKKWQDYWAEHGSYQVENDDPRPKFYCLCMYPYPSGSAHQGHVRNYTFGDLITRHRTMHGYAVLSPMGFDSFGLPAENAALKTGVHPRLFTDERIAELKASILRLGAQYDLAVEGREELKLRVFTTRPDTTFGMTYAVLAPEHPLVDELTTADRREEVQQFVARVTLETEVERQSAEGPIQKRGVFTGSHVVNPFNRRPVPVYLADYVLMGYGSGAIMAVPGEDQRDWDFAKAYGLPIIRTVQPPDDWEGEAYTGDGPAINSEWLDGLPKTEAIAKAIEFLEEK